MCVADGHWGTEASRHSSAFWTQNEEFPGSQAAAIKLTQQLESDLYTASNLQNPDPEVDRPAETAFVAVELKEYTLRFISYGDCRILLVRDGQIVMRNEIRPTWLGAFSYLKLRGRLAGKDAVEFREASTVKGDTILIFSDGVDECVYDTPTLSDEFLIQATEYQAGASVYHRIMDEVLRQGAEDNASLAVIRV